MQGIPLQHWLIVATLLFSLGLYGVIARRNAIAVLMGIEVMFAAANINFLAFWRYLHLNPAGDPSRVTLEAPVFVTIIILVAACEAAVALAVVLSVFRRFRSIDVESVDLMQG
jgi:NADH-quinone oxidoreductase subunit K